MSYISDDYQCEECGHVWTELNARDNRPDKLDCEAECGLGELSAIKLFSSPTPLRHSFHDGVNRGDSWKKLKEASKLNKQMLGMPHEKRGELRSEIRKLKKTDK